MRADLRFAIRSFLRAPGFFLLASITLALGIAATTSIFSLFYQVLLRPLPAAHPERLVVLHSGPPGLPGGSSSDNSETVFSYPLYLRLRDAAPEFQGILARAGAPAQIAHGGVAEFGGMEVVSGNFFEVLGLRPYIGRLLGPADDSVRGGNPVAVLSYDYWRRRFGGSPSAIGQKLLLNGMPFTIVGVAPANFHGVLSGNTPELFVPISMKAALEPGWNSYDRPNSQWLNLIARLAPGVSREAAQARLQPLFTAILRDHVKQIGVHSKAAEARLLAKRAELRPASQGLNELERQWRRPLLALLGMVILLLLVGCANLANLLIARAMNRAREISIRLALGAGRWRVIRLLLAESLTVACAGALFGILLAPVLTRGLLGLMPESAVGGWLTAGLNLPLLGFCIALMLTATFLFGLLPAVHLTRRDSGALAERTQTSSGGTIHGRSRKLLVMGQLVLSLVLLTAAGLFGRSLANLMTRSPGFRTAHLLVFNLDPGLGGYSVNRGLELYHELIQRLSHLPGVESASLSEWGILAHSEASTNVSVEGFRPNAEEDAICDINAIGAGFFRTLGSPLLAGREFDERDQAAGAPKVAIVNRTFVRHFLAGRSAVGTRMSMGSGGPLDMRIVGVVGDIKSLNLRDPAKPTYYVPYEPSLADAKRIRQATYFVRADAGFDTLPGAVRATLAQLDRGLPVFELHPMEVQVEDSVYTDRLIAALSTAFGLLALILTAVGLYGVIAHMVTRRTSEIGIRMALGATRWDVLSLVMREVFLLTIGGVAAGLVGSLAAGRAIQTLLFGVGGSDWTIFALASAVLAVVALCAGLLPALRASRIEPLQALRHE